MDGRRRRIFSSFCLSHPFLPVWTRNGGHFSNSWFLFYVGREGTAERVFLFFHFLNPQNYVDCLSSAGGWGKQIRIKSNLSKHFYGVNFFPGQMARILVRNLAVKKCFLVSKSSLWGVLWNVHQNKKRNVIWISCFLGTSAFPGPFARSCPDEWHFFFLCIFLSHSCVRWKREKHLR